MKNNVKMKWFICKGIFLEWCGVVWFYYVGGFVIFWVYGGFYDKFLCKIFK